MLKSNNSEHPKIRLTEQKWGVWQEREAKQ
jgi:hypothetical protein